MFGFLFEQVYNGFVGEKLSYKTPQTEWEALQRAGVKQIIDVRYKYNSAKFVEKCRQYGFRYFNYPVHYDTETIDEMVRKYSQFAELLVEGKFYLMGHTHGLVALAIFWTFSKSPDYYPMELRDSVRNNKRIMTKAIPVIRAMEKRWKTEIDKEREGGDYISESIDSSIDDFINEKYPAKLKFSFVDFTRQHRNGGIVYDISVDGFGRVGFLYPTNSGWSYDIVMYPNGMSTSGSARTFKRAQNDIVYYLCDILPHSVKYVSIPQSMKLCIQLMRKQLY